MATLLVHMETSPFTWDSWSPELKTYFKKRWFADFFKDNNDDIDLPTELYDRFAYFPFTSKIIYLSLYDLERNLGAVYFLSEAEQADDFTTETGFVCKSRREKELLEDFWEGAKNYDLFVTFNGHKYTLPFLYLRSTVYGIKPTVSIARQRFITKQNLPYHVDLMDEFSFYGAIARPSLVLLNEIYGLGYDLGGVRERGLGAERASTRSLRTQTALHTNHLLAIKDLFNIWKLNLAPPSFINNYL